MIPVSYLPDLLKALPQPLGLAGAPRAWVVRVCLNLGLTSSYDESTTEAQLKFRDVLSLLVKFNFQQQMRDELPAEGEKAAEALAAAGSEEEPSKQRAGTSMLWAGGMNDEKRTVAREYAIELLKLSHGPDAICL